MNAQIITAYVNQLAELLRATRVTGRDGTTIHLDVGAMYAVELIFATRNDGKKAMVIGNGGSAAVASHTQNDLFKAVGMRALAFNEAPLMTAMANDDGYGSVFESQISQWAEAGDLLIAISSSGRSENIIRAVRAAEGRGCSIITFSGFREDNPLRRSGDFNFYVPSESYGLVESAHAVLTHFLTDNAVGLVKDNYHFFSRLGDILRETAAV